MSDKPHKTRPLELYEEYREKSGWYLAAWRDWAGLTLEELASELGRSRGYISDLETGAVRKDRPPTRFNRDLVQQVANAVGTKGGRLIDVNPFTAWEHEERLNSTLSRLADEDRNAVLDMAERLVRKDAAA
ncbi:helix-turn-helix domain-containing protein [Brevundimonas sp. LjRoot202]|uniref:helix-turn-helix domain-containing protein n=1 Tax=Brevundimonas sp. LjRoot202 TaxID=3342281 RepID=UPI003ECFE027